jgi:hypothetical protein
MSIKFHQIEGRTGLNETIQITPQGEPGKGGAHTRYLLELKTPTHEMSQMIQFQNGPISDPSDFNGWTNEALLAILLHRAEGFINGPFKHQANQDAFDHLYSAMIALKSRTLERAQRGVEGKHVA